MRIAQYVFISADERVFYSFMTDSNFMPFCVFSALKMHQVICWKLTRSARDSNLHKEMKVKKLKSSEAWQQKVFAFLLFRSCKNVEINATISLPARNLPTFNLKIILSRKTCIVVSREKFSRKSVFGVLIEILNDAEISLLKGEKITR